MTIALLLMVAFLAYANGSNDNSKGVATLVGYGAASERAALIYATLATLVGAIVSFWFSGGMLKKFSTGLFTGGVELGPTFYIAVLIGSIGWVAFATQTGLPVSTTHAILGSLLGAGLVAFSHDKILWAALGRGFLLPLILSPLLATVIVYLLAWPIAAAVRKPRIETETLVEVAQSSTGVAVIAAEQTRVVTSRSANTVHWFSAGLISFARGWNDTPKIAALCLLALPGKMGFGFLIVAVAMAAGGIISGRKVLTTLSKKLTPLPLLESLTASLSTAVLVCLASWEGLPVSTTHVSTGAIIGGGLKNDPQGVQWKKVIEIVLSWIITLPAAALIAALAKWLLH